MCRFGPEMWKNKNQIQFIIFNEIKRDLSREISETPWACYEFLWRDILFHLSRDIRWTFIKIDKHTPRRLASRKRFSMLFDGSWGLVSLEPVKVSVIRWDL